MVQYPFTKESSESIQSVLKNEGMVCFPTETIYGLGGNALSLKVVEKIFALKKRPLEKSLSVLVDQEWLGKLAYWEDDKIDRIIENFWPGPLTLVLPARRELPEFLKGPNQTIALRWSSSSVVQEMIKLGECPLIGTSANLSGMPSCSSSAEVVDPALFEQPSEAAMLKVLDQLTIIVMKPGRDRYSELCEALAGSAATLSEFFDGESSVMVMAKDESVRRNRLNLLSVLRNQAAVLADFSLISG